MFLTINSRNFIKPCCCMAAVLIAFAMMMMMMAINTHASTINPVERTTYGVGPELLDKYTQKSDKQQFQCLQSKEMISFDGLNDNYCDCKDGSDEPGTSACSNAMLSFNADTKFYCRNKMYKPQYISHSKVNE